MSEATEYSDRAEIREMVDNWMLWRDAGDWERFRTLWHSDGQVSATWWQGPYEEFIRVSQEGFDHGVRILHFLGGKTVELAGDRALSQTKMTITQRAEVHGVLCDVICTGRLCHFFERRDGRWGMLLHQAIYEMDRLAPVSGGPGPQLDQSILERFPDGYRHLAYVQTLAGYDVKRDMPCLTGPELEALYGRCRAWLDGTARTP